MKEGEAEERGESDPSREPGCEQGPPLGHPPFPSLPLPSLPASFVPLRKVGAVLCSGWNESGCGGGDGRPGLSHCPRADKMRLPDPLFPHPRNVPFSCAPLRPSVPGLSILG